MLNKELKERAEKTIQAARERIADFSRQLTENPERVLESNMSVFRDTAKLAVWTFILARIEDHDELAELIVHVENITLRRALQAPAAIPVTANLLQLEMTAAYAEVLFELKQIHKSQKMTAS